MPDGIHSHNFGGETTFNDGHVHGYRGTTSLNPNFPGHIHSMMGDTTFNDGHIHRYLLSTGPGIRVAGGHIHYYEAATSYNDGHIHYLRGYTTIYG